MAIFQQQSGTRNRPISQRLAVVLNAAAAAAGVDVRVFSGGQAAKGTKGARTGSTRHDLGGAADLWLEIDGRKLVESNPKDLPIIQEFVRAAVENGATGIGGGAGYMGPGKLHIGFNRSELKGAGLTLWGPGETSKTTPAWLKQAVTGKALALGNDKIDPAADPFGVVRMQTARDAANEMATAAPPRTLRRGMSGPDVDALGQQLAALGYDTGTPRDKFGRQTAAAIRDLEQKSGGFLDIDRRGREAAGPQVRDLLAGTDRTRDIFSVRDLASLGGPHGAGYVPGEAPQDIAFGGLSPAMPWDAPGGPSIAPRPVPTTPIGPDPIYADDAVIAAMSGAPGGPGPTDLESAMGPSTPPPIPANPEALRNAWQIAGGINGRPSYGLTQPAAPGGLPAATGENPDAGLRDLAKTLSFDGMSNIMPQTFDAGLVPGGPGIDPATLAILEQRAGIRRPPVGNVNYDDVAAADRFSPPRMPPSFGDVDWNGPQIERSAVAGGPPVANGQGDIIDRFSPGVSIQDVIDTFFGSREPGKAGSSITIPYAVPPGGDDIQPGLSSPAIPGGVGQQSSLMGFGGDDVMIGGMGDLTSLPPIARTSPSASVGLGPSGGEPRPLTPGGPGYVVADDPRANGVFDMNAAPFYAPPPPVSIAGSPADQAKRAMSDAMRSSSVTGAGRSIGNIGGSSGSSAYSTVTPAQTNSYIQNYLGSFGFSPGQYGVFGSAFVPGGFTPPNFDPISGGSVYAIDKDRQTYIDSNGVERSIW